MSYPLNQFKFGERIIYEPELVVAQAGEKVRHSSKLESGAILSNKLRR
jgi:hypothetical protein